MIRQIATVATGTLASRLLGFVRDALLAALLGAGPIADAFLLAFQVINVARRLLGEGALNAALVPAYLQRRSAEGPEAAAAFAGRVMGTLAIGTLSAAVVAALAMPWIVARLAPDLAGRPHLQFAIEASRLMLPYLAFAGPVAVAMALRNAAHRVALSAFSPLLFNAALIGVTLVLLSQSSPDGSVAALALAATVGAVGCLQALVLLLPGDMPLRAIRVSLDADMRAFLRRALPTTLAQTGPQILLVAAAIAASASPSAVAWLYFASRLIELPLGLASSAMGLVLVPSLAHAVDQRDRAAFMAAQSRGLELTLAMALPASAGLIVLAEPIVSLLFAHGAFSAHDAEQTARALLLLALGLPGHALAKALSPAFFARGETRTPLIATLAGLLTTTAVAAFAAPGQGHVGAALAVTLGAWMTAAVLGLQLARTDGLLLDTASRRRMPLLIAASAVMAIALAAANHALKLPAGAGTWTAAAHLAVMIGLGAMVYLALLTVLKALDWRQAVQALRRRA